MRRVPLLFVTIFVLALVFTGCDAGGTAAPDDGPGSGAPVTAFVHVNLVPMTQETVLANQTVLVEGPRIVQIGPSEVVAVPEGATIIEGTGVYLMPGLADMHMHTREDWLDDAWPVSPLHLFLANGVTTVRDFGPQGAPLTYTLRWREQISAGELDGPTLYASGEILYASPVPAASVVRRNHAQGFDFQKLYSYLSPQDFKAALATAEELGMYTAGHIPYAVGLDGVLAAGMDEIAHVEELDFECFDFDRDMDLTPDGWLSYLMGAFLEQYDITQGFDAAGFQARHGATLAAIADKLRTAGIPVCTTLVIDDVIVQKLFHPWAFEARPENVYLPQGYMDAFDRGEEKHQQQFKGGENLAAFKYGLDQALLRALHGAGVPLLLATDCGTGGMGIVPGFSIHDELRILTENGFTPYQALAAGTVEASKVVAAMRGVDDFGTVEVGKRADLLLLRENPLQDVAHVRAPLGVMAAGRWYPAETLAAMIALDD